MSEMYSDKSYYIGFIHLWYLPQGNSCRLYRYAERYTELMRKLSDLTGAKSKITNITSISYVSRKPGLTKKNLKNRRNRSSFLTTIVSNAIPAKEKTFELWICERQITSSLMRTFLHCTRKITIQILLEFIRILYLSQITWMRLYSNLYFESFLTLTGKHRRHSSK